MTGTKAALTFPLSSSYSDPAIFFVGGKNKLTIIFEKEESKFKKQPGSYSGMF